MVHASPRIIGTPQVSASGGQRSISQIAMTSPAGPEKPQRYSIDFIVYYLLYTRYFQKKFTFILKKFIISFLKRLFEDNKQRSISQGNPPRGVRFQDPKEEEENNKVFDLKI